jgi:lysophospholipid acyltransferase
VPEFRRHVRPFFLTPDGSNPTAYKRYYDIASYLATQLTLSFTVMPFIFLSFGDSIAVWRSVYFYGIIGNIASLAFFASAAKGLLVKKLKARNKPHVPRTVSSENMRQPTLGLPNDAIQEFDDAVQEIRAEIESRERRGSLVNMPTGDELKAAVENKISSKN